MSRCRKRALVVNVTFITWWLHGVTRPSDFPRLKRQPGSCSAPVSYRLPPLVLGKRTLFFHENKLFCTENHKSGRSYNIYHKVHNIIIRRCVLVLIKVRWITWKSKYFIVRIISLLSRGYDYSLFEAMTESSPGTSCIKT